MKKSVLAILIGCMFLFFVAGNAFSAPVGLTGDDIMFHSPTPGEKDTFYQGYLGDTWTGYYIGTVLANINTQDEFEEIVERYLGEYEFTSTYYDKVDVEVTKNEDGEIIDIELINENDLSLLSITYNDNLMSGNWAVSGSYALGFYAVKGSTETAFYFVEPYQDNGDWTTAHLRNNGGNVPEISHLGASATSVPEPATMLWLGTAMFGLFMVSRKKFMK